MYERQGAVLRVCLPYTERMFKIRDYKIKENPHMKKFLAIFLALLTASAVALTACNKKDKENDDENENWDNDYTYNYNVGTSANTGTGTGLNNDSLGDNNFITGTWVNTNDTVYIQHPTYLRYSTSKNDTSSTQVNFGDSLTRISTNNVWDKVLYNDAEYYVFSYLTTEKKGDVTFTDVTDDGSKKGVINKDTSGTNPTQVNLRTTPCFDEDLDNLGASALTKAMTTADGVTFKVLAINETKTWAKVQFKGKDARNLDIDGVFYVRPSYLEFFQTEGGGTAGGVNPV